MNGCHPFWEIDLLTVINYFTIYLIINLFMSFICTPNTPNDNINLVLNLMYNHCVFGQDQVVLRELSSK